ncbi:fructosamine kinase [Marmoricola sp. Leaf446]|uniref:fructosamine kinase family protein n=1 Tax=Marmoricola sp. Leaf446 TaxID=1736379 RepID=UPI0006F5BFEA|nr:fructosamine kinase family protein [Marmoricola sp. Leaf446]KQT92094.1 fructosamine kinase [Marmoricola sp. Leaf446]
MARSRGVADLVERLLGTPVAATTPVAGGDTCVTTRVRLGDGRSALVKTRSGAPEDFFAAEARGLRWLAEPDVVPVAEVLAVDHDCLVVAWVEPGRPSPEAAADLGRGLALLHASGAEGFGAGQDGFVGALPLPNRPVPTWPEFFAVRRVLPYLRVAVDRGHVEPRDAAAVEGVVRRIEQLAGPTEPPARLHGDLWSGNVVWGTERAHLIDPAAHGGHRETDLALLALFGAPHLDRLVAAYDEERPLADGWRDRQPLHQLFPVLLHAAMFGGGYGARAGELARRL